MKKTVIILISFFTLFCTACGEENTSTSEDYIVYSDDSGNCSFKVIDNIDELADYIIDNRYENTSKAFEHSAQKDNISEFTMYTLGNIPTGYLLDNIRTSESSSLVTMNYIKDNGTSISKIVFVWDYKNNGDSFFQDTIENLGLELMPGMPGYYYVQTVDDMNQNIYQIYWVEDGYRFQANIPTYLIGESESNDIAVLTGDNTSDESQMKLTLKKTDYPIN